MFLIYLSLPMLLATVPGISGGPEFQCPGPGFYPDPYSCTAFYRCINRFMNYRYLCPAGTRYDPRVSNCNHNFLAPPCVVAVRPQPGGQWGSQSGGSQSAGSGSQNGVSQESQSSGSGSQSIGGSGSQNISGSGSQSISGSGSQSISGSGSQFVGSGSGGSSSSGGQTAVSGGQSGGSGSQSGGSGGQSSGSGSQSDGSGSQIGGSGSQSGGSGGQMGGSGGQSSGSGSQFGGSGSQFGGSQSGGSESQSGGSGSNGSQSVGNGSGGQSSGSGSQSGGSGSQSGGSGSNGSQSVGNGQETGTMYPPTMKPSEADGSSGAVEAPVNTPQQGGAQDGGDQESSGKQLIVPRGQNGDDDVSNEVIGGAGEEGGENAGETEDFGGNEDYDGVISIGDGDEEGPITDIDIPGENGGQQEAITRPPPTEQDYTLDPDSIYPCDETGYFAEVSNCREFYMCREVLPGVLKAERIFRCPPRYLFDRVTNLCQRQEKVVCDDPGYLSRSSLAVDLTVSDLDTFFNQVLYYQGTSATSAEKGRFSLPADTQAIQTTYHPSRTVQPSVPVHPQQTFSHRNLLLAPLFNPFLHTYHRIPQYNPYFFLTK